MDRLSFSVKNQVSEFSETFLFLCLIFRNRSPRHLWQGFSGVAKSGRAIWHSHEALQANRYLDSVVTRINTIYYRLCEQSEAVTAQMVRDEFLGVKAPSKTLLSVFAEFNDRQENLIGVDITQSTFNKFDLTLRRLEEFLRVKRNRQDIPVSLVDRDFVLDFEAYLKVDYRLQANSAEKLMRIFKRITTMCFKSGLMTKDPFCDVRLKKVKKDRGYLTRHELELILNYKPTKKRLEKARDVFVFCCFTGFDYSTTASLTEQNLVLADDGSMWIETHRVKTGVASKVKLLDIPLSILKKYESITPYSTRSITINSIIALCGALTPF